MLGVKLRSDRVDTYDELGERGQPVYRVAPQILEVLRRHGQHSDIAKHFAIPRANDDGSVVDWYAPEEGDVIPWSSATPEERQSMRSQLLRVQSVLQDMAEKIRTEDVSGDRRLFGSLLRWVSYFPDFSYIYQVNQRAVICFWGFIHAGADRSCHPLHIPEPVPELALAPMPAITAAAVPSPAQPAVSPVAPVAVAPEPTPWWKRWWMWLLLALLLLLLLFGLRSCLSQAGLPNLSVAGFTPALPNIAVDVAPPTLPTPRVPATGFSMPSLPAVNLPALGISGTDLANNSASAPALDVGGGSPPSLPSQGAPADAAAAPAEGPTVSAPPPDIEAAPAGNVPPIVPDAQNAPASPPLLSSQAPGSATGPGLTIPADARDGRADFLNGHWRAGAGIQDRATGAPLRLEYQFEKGEGHVLLRRHNGVECKAPTSASMTNGSLLLTNSSQAACSDGTAYELPKVECKPDANTSANCQGDYGDARFPMSMRQARP